MLLRKKLEKEFFSLQMCILHLKKDGECTGQNSENY